MGVECLPKKLLFTVVRAGRNLTRGTERYDHELSQRIKGNSDMKASLLKRFQVC
jgi:hypothetical protein